MAELNIIDTITWIGLLKYKKALVSVVCGETLDVLAGDPETVDHLCKLVDRSGDELIIASKEEGYFRIRIKKGPVERV